MRAGNFTQELAERRVDEELDAGIARIQSDLKGEGAVACIDCACDIPKNRIAAYPSARRCIRCQSKFEDSMRRCA
jgi:RNA polymerase-binding transcription factor DksA